MWGVAKSPLTIEAALINRCVLSDLGFPVALLGVFIRTDWADIHALGGQVLLH